jgi:ATP-binding cassette subfamily B protein
MALVIGMLVNEIKLVLEDQQPDFMNAAGWLAVAAVMILVGNASSILGQYCRLRLTDELRLSISKQTFQHAATLDLGFFEDPGSQNILSRATQNPGGDFLGFVVDAMSTFELALQMISLLGVLIWIDPLMTPLLLVLAVPWFLFRWHIAKIRFDIFRSKTTQRRWSRYYTSKLVNRLSIPAVKLLGLAPFLLERYERTMHDLMEVNRSIYRKQALGGIAAAMLFALGFLLVVGLVGYRSLHGSIAFNLLITYLLAAFRLRGSVVELINKLSSSFEKVLNITNLQEFLNVKPTLSEGGTLAPKEVEGEIELSNVTFSYRGTDNPVLCNVNLQIQPGETIALVGPNGSGKTTLVKLICRLYEPDRGKIILDGKDIQEYSLGFLHGQIAYVDQHNVRFEASVEENIAYGDWKQLIGQPDRVRKIAQRANIESMILDMPEGFNTRLGRMFGQFDLSGGQWQKIAVARALARNASIYILDEPTAHLDAQSEFEVFSGLKDLVKNRTTILISHRFTTARMADRIYVMDNGRVVQQGAHAELMEKGGLYKELYSLHRSSFISTDEPTLGGAQQR